jgi:hypothetical protein
MMLRIKGVPSMVIGVDRLDHPGNMRGRAWLSFGSVPQMWRSGGGLSEGALVCPLLKFPLEIKAFWYNYSSPEVVGRRATGFHL